MSKSKNPAAIVFDKKTIEAMKALGMSDAEIKSVAGRRQRVEKRKEDTKEFYNAEIALHYLGLVETDEDKHPSPVEGAPVWVFRRRLAVVPAGKTKIKVYTRSGEFEREITLPKNDKEIAEMQKHYEDGMKSRAEAKAKRAARKAKKDSDDE